MTVLLRKGVTPADMLTCIYPQTQFTHIADITQLISRDYSERGFIATGTVPPLYGMGWIGVEDRPEGGVMGTQCMVLAKNSLGLALGDVENMRDISWRNDLNAWQIGAKLLGGATVIDKEMLVGITVTA